MSPAALDRRARGRWQRADREGLVLWTLCALLWWGIAIAQAVA